MRRWRDWWTPLRVLDAAMIALVLFIVLWSLHPNLVFSSSLITGGDTGSHLALPAYLRSTNALFSLNLTPWYPGWFAGMPAYTYYFVLPDVLAAAASYVINFAVAFKLATLLGSFLLPVTAYLMGRLFRAPRPIPLALAMGTLPFLFDASFTIDGGNLFSTMAGEYAFSLSLALALLSIGFFARGVREGRGYWAAAITLSLTLASHVLPWFYTLAAVAVLVLFEILQRFGIGDPRAQLVRGDRARPVRFAVGATLLSLGLSAWWLIAFATTQSYTNAMGYTNDNVSTLHAIFTTLGWFTTNGGAAGDRWVIALATMALLVAFGVRDRLGMFLATMTALALAAFVLDPQGAIWNERLTPFWFIGIHLLAGWLVGYLALAVVRRRNRADEAEVYVDEDATVLVIDDEEGREQRRLTRLVRATSLVALLGVASTLPGLVPPIATALHLTTSGNEVSNWAQWNYEGYQGMTAWPEYHDLMTTMATVGAHDGCGRAMWEYNADENRFGTPEALMLLPYWTNNCIDSMEGLLFESSATTPYHFLDQAELSASPSDPMVGLPYGGVNLALGVRHLQQLGVKYYIAFTPSIVAQANADPLLHQVALTKAWPAPGVQWHVYEIADAPIVAPLRVAPNVVPGLTSASTWLLANVNWWTTPSADEGPLLAATGPKNWPHVAGITHLRTRLEPAGVRVRDVTIGLSGVSFHVNRLGTPIEVKVSYYPRWHVRGASGPYRVSPNLMVVVPTSHQVTLTYGASPAVEWGNLLTDATMLLGLAALGWRWRRRRRQKRAL